MRRIAAVVFVVGLVVFVVGLVAIPVALRLWWQHGMQDLDTTVNCG